MIEILAMTLWVCFALYATWYLTSAKHYAPITLNEARILWKIHKKDIRCDGRKWREIRHRDKLVGFECECGYKHVQKRPVTANTPMLEFKSETSTFDRLRTSYKSK